MKTLTFSIFLAGFLLVTNCGQSEPQDIKPGGALCTFCQMGISDMRFHTEIITKNGKLLHFDSLECAIAYQMKNHLEGAHIFVPNYSDPSEWLTLDREAKEGKWKKATILQSKDIPSPMAGGLAASAADKVDELKEKFHAEEMDLETAKNYLKNSWEAFGG